MAHTMSGPSTQPTTGSTKSASAEKCAIIPQVRSFSDKASGFGEGVAGVLVFTHT